jgi:Flp pilus assembly protein CpaB
MKDRLMLFVAVVAGLVATVLTFVYIDSTTSEDDAAPVRTLEVLFTINDIPANSSIDADADLRVETINIEATPGIARGAVKVTDRAAVDGRPISAPIPAGVPLLYSHLTPVQDVDLGAGMRAIAISVSRENLMGGILVPGDRVDIVVSYEAPKAPPAAPAPTGGDDPEAMVANMMGGLMGQLGDMGGSSVPSDWVAEEVLSNIRVIAVGSALSGSRQSQMFGMGGGGKGSTITLELSPQNALELIRAQANGKNPLTLMLRPGDASVESATSSLTGG